MGHMGVCMCFLHEIPYKSLVQKGERSKSMEFVWMLMFLDYIAVKTWVMPSCAKTWNNL